MTTATNSTRVTRRQPVRRKGRRPKLTKDEKALKRRDRKFRTAINTVFTNAKFIQIATRDTQLVIAGRQGDFDSFFVYENILVVMEDTTAAEVKDHLLKSANFFDHVAANTSAALDELASKFPKFRSSSGRGKYGDTDYRWVFVYCSLKAYDRKYEERHLNVVFLRYASLQYFLTLSKTIGGSIRFELFKFLRLRLGEIGIQKQGQDKREYDALILPESPSGFPAGHKIVSFLIEPETLLEQAYVLRKDGWQDGDCLYQRLLVKGKIGKMRDYLSSERRVFINNIIATLPEDTRFLDAKGAQVAPHDLSAMTKITVELRRKLGSIGLIDGQHRVFAYHEGQDQADKAIGLLRAKQHLLVTGIVYPPGTDALERTRFEAKLFLEINDKQTRAKGDLKQAIQTIIEPFSDVAIAKRVVNSLAATGPLCGYLEEHFFDRGKIKTTSIVSYGMRHVVAINGVDSLFQVWPQTDKKKLQQHKSQLLLDEYVRFCSNHVSAFIQGFHRKVPPAQWTADRKVSRALTTTTINGLIFCLRNVIQRGKTGDASAYHAAFAKCAVDFTPGKFTYRSSHWRELGKKLYDQCFS